MKIKQNWLVDCTLTNSKKCEVRHKSKNNRKNI